MPLLQFLGSGGDGNLEWWMLLISVISSAILVLMTMSVHKQLAHNLVSTNMPHLLMVAEDVYTMDDTGLFIEHTKLDIVQGKVCGRKIQKGRLTLLLL